MNMASLANNMSLSMAKEVTSLGCPCFFISGNFVHLIPLILNFSLILAYPCSRTFLALLSVVNDTQPGMVGLLQISRVALRQTSYYCYESE